MCFCTRQGRLTLVRSQCRDAKCVYIRLQQRAERIINHLMSLYPAYVRKFVRHDCHGKVPLAIPCTGVPRMQVALIFNLQLFRRETGFQRLTYSRLTRFSQGNTFLNGFTTTRAYTPASM